MKLNKSELVAKIRALQREIDSLMDLVIALDEEPSIQVQTVNEPDDWMTAKQTCKRLKISETTFYEYVKAGLLPKGYKFGPKSKRWRMSDILSWQISKFLTRQNSCDIISFVQLLYCRRGSISCHGFFSMQTMQRRFYHVKIYNARQKYYRRGQEVSCWQVFNTRV